VTTLLHRYAPRGAARTVLTCRDDEVLLAGPAGTGKSRSALEKLNLIMLKYPGAAGLIVRKTSVSLTSTSLVTFDKWVVAELVATGAVVWYGGSKRKPAQYQYANGSTINVGGMDKPTKIMSSEYDVVYVAEATELVVDDWEAITTRLRNGVVPYQQILADCNPDAPTHWLKQRADSGVTTMLHSRHEDNPMLFDADGTLTERGAVYIGRLDNLTGVRLQRLRHGRWVAAEGAIYEEWDPAVHLVDALPAGSAQWRRFWSIDFGFTNPTVVQRWAEDPDGRLWLYAETYRTQRTADQHAEAVLDEVAPKDRRGNRRWVEPRPDKILADWDAAGRELFSRTVGIPTTAANKDVLNGITAFQQRLRLAGDGRPRLYVVRGACRDRDGDLAERGLPTCTEQEIPGYVWKQHANNEGKKEEPVKENDHGCDAARYLVADRDLRGEYKVRWIG